MKPSLRAFLYFYSCLLTICLTVILVKIGGPLQVQREKDDFILYLLNRGASVQAHPQHILYSHNPSAPYPIPDPPDGDEPP